MATDAAGPEPSGISAIPAQDVHQICSGQVVVDLATAVKELLENALDAGSTCVEIRLKDSGLESIEVTDNGTGIEPQNFQSLALKHHTSKLRTFNELDAVTTASFGFRGEALSSLCGLSTSLSVTTRHASQPVGCALSFGRNGALVSQKAVARPVGTTVRVDRLFAPLAVRRAEFRRTIKRHFTRLLRVVQAYAIIATGVRIVCQNVHSMDSCRSTAGEKGKGKGKGAGKGAAKARAAQQPQLAVATQGSGGLRSNIINVFGAKFAKTLLPVDLKLQVDGDAAGSSGGAEAEAEAEADAETEAGAEAHQGVSHGETDGDGDGTSGRVDAYGAEARARRDRGSGDDSDPKPRVVGFVSAARSGVGRSDNDRQFLYINGRPVDLPPLTKALNETWRQYMMKQKPAAVLDLQLPPGSFDVNVTPDKREVFLVRPHEVLAALREGLRVLWEPSRSTFSVQHVLPFEKKDKVREEAVTQDQEPKADNSRGQKHIPATTTLEDDHSAAVIDGGTDGDNSSERARMPDESIADTNASGSGDGNRGAKRPRRECLRDFVNVAPPEPGVSNDATLGSGDVVSDGATMSVEDGADAHSKQLGHRVTKRARQRRIQHAPLQGSAMELESDASADVDIVVSSDADVDVNAAVDVNDNAGAKATAEAETEAIANTDAEIDSEGTTKIASASPQSAHTQDIEMFRAMEVALDGVSEIDTELAGVGASADVSANVGSEMAAAESVAEGNAASESPPFVPAALVDTHRDMTMKCGMRSIRAALRAQVEAQQTACSTGAQCESSESDGALSLVPSDHSATDAEGVLERVLTKCSFRRMQVLGQFNKGFIIAKLPGGGKRDEQASNNDALNPGTSSGDDLFILDQHACDEKYNFERLQQHTTIHQQPLLRPKSMDLTAIEEMTVLENLSIFERNGFRFEVDRAAAPSQRLRLAALPFSKGTQFDEQDVHELASLLMDTPGKMCRLPKATAMFASRACRSSIMIGTDLDYDIMVRTVQRLAELHQPWNCPHGRPTMRHLAVLSAARRCDIGSGTHH